ncbi:MAG: peptidylprolyl isomerase [Alphaproteobacteria bacterium]|nr:peptidylprolyl isomerase [Alphaproteobacteria bacterium]
MKKFMILFLMGIFSGNAHAQFAPGYAPRYDDNAIVAEEDEEEPVSSVFQTQQEPIAPRPEIQEIIEPPAIKIPTPYTSDLRILAVVNGDIITTEDINNRVRAFCMTTGIPYNEQTKVMITNKVMQNTIDEKIKLQDAIKNKIEISEEDIDNAIAGFLESNSVSLPDFRKMLREFGVSNAVFREQMKSDLSWLRLIRSKTANDKVSESEIQEALAVTKKDMSKEKYMVSEIVIDLKEARDVNQLSQTLRRDPRFEMYASQFSKAPSSASGGRLGWVNAGQLPMVLDNALKKMSEGEVSDPIVYNNAYYILKVEKKFDPKKDTLPAPKAEEIAEMLQGQKTERYAERYLQGLRQRASIELKE